MEDSQEENLGEEQQADPLMETANITLEEEVVAKKSVED
jgi:hypothetical protein